MQRQASDRHGTVRFLKHLLHQIPGKLLVIWDGLPAHRGETVQSLLSRPPPAQLARTAYRTPSIRRTPTIFLVLAT